MEDCVDEGLVKYIGLSNFNSEQIQRILDVARIKPVINQVLCSTICFFGDTETINDTEQWNRNDTETINVFIKDNFQYYRWILENEQLMEYLWNHFAFPT